MSCEAIVHSRVCQLEKAVASFASDCQLMGDRPDILCPPSAPLRGRITLPPPLLSGGGFSPLSFSQIATAHPSLFAFLAISSNCVVIFHYCQLLRPPSNVPFHMNPQTISRYPHWLLLSYFSIADCWAGDIFCPQQTEEDEKARNGK